MKPLEITGLSKVYKRKISQKVVALDNINLTINQGEIFGYLGPNGAGKSTTIKLILDIIRPTSGDVKVFGVSSNIPQSREKIGYLPENPVFYDYLTSKELLLYTAKNHNTYKNNNELLKRIDEVLERLDLIHVKDSRLRTYSKGMVQRAGIAQAIIADPDLLILDEPASGLDPIGRKLVTDILLELKEAGKTIFFSSHILHDVETICDKVGIIIKGELKFTGLISDLLSSKKNEFEIVSAGISIQDLSKEPFSQLKFHKEGETIKFILEEKDIWPILDSIRKIDGKIISVQPLRKNLEDTFFDFMSLNEG